MSASRYTYIGFPFACSPDPQVAVALEASGVRAPQDKAKWSAAQVRRMLGKATG